jgi:hypothetical protein
MVSEESDPVEFPRCIKIDEIGTGDSSHVIEANEQERAALAKRFDLLRLNELCANIALCRHPKGIMAKGRFTAKFDQTCIASNEALSDSIDDAIEVLFAPLSAQQPANDAEIELAVDDCDMMTHDGRVVDIGEAVAQSLGLTMNPYPRSSDAEQRLRDAGVKRDDDVIAPDGPFAALSAIKDKMARK